jgi:2-dehydro-3-deoxyglucarate aldolase/4-hydroxy-2-oxoheptanedioate aldolase
MLMATTRCTNLVPLVRVPATEYHFMARALDAGAMGLMVPMVETPEQARRIVEFTKYPPAGKRGAAFGVAHDDYTGGDIVAKMRAANDETMIIALIESVQGIENVEAIAAVEGIDVLWLGHFDLTNSQGIPGQFTHPAFLAAVEKLLAAAKKQGKAAGMMAGNVPDAKARLAQGFRCLAYGGDLWLYQNALREGIEGVRREG